MFKLGKNFIFRMALLQKPFLGQKSLIIFSYGSKARSGGTLASVEPVLECIFMRIN